jgi:hypothetical protein
LGDGLAIWYRRLEERTFVFPKLAEGSGLSGARAVGKQGLEIRGADLAMLHHRWRPAHRQQYQRANAEADRHEPEE